MVFGGLEVGFGVIGGELENIFFFGGVSLVCFFGFLMFFFFFFLGGVFFGLFSCFSYFVSLIHDVNAF